MSHVRPPRIKLTKHTYSQLKTALRNAPTPSDRSEHNLTEIALRESEAFYQQMFESNRAVKMVVDPATAQIIKANQAACNFYGYSHEQMTSLRITDISVISKDELAADIQRTLVDKGKTFEARHRMASGEIRDVEIFSGAIEVNGKHYLYAIIQDITEHKRAEKALRESEELHRLLIQHMPNSSVFMFDQDMRYKIADGPFLKRFGSFYDGIVGKLLQETLPQAALDVLVPIHQRALNGEAFTYERVLPEYAYQAYVTPVRDDKGKIIGGMILSQDITEHKNAEQALHESETRYQSVVTTMSEGVIVHNKDGTIQTANTSAERMLGLTIDQMMGRTSIDPRWRAIHEDGSPFPGETHPAMITRQTGEPQNAVIMGVHKPDDSLVWISINSRPLLHPDEQRPYAAVVTMIDITERKLAEDALRESEARFRSLVDLAPVGIIQNDAQGKRIFCNKYWADMVGLTLEQALATDFEPVHPDDVSDYVAALHKMFDTSQPITNLVIRYKRPDDSVFWSLGNAKPIFDEQGNVTSFIGVAADISPRKALEDELRASEDRFHSLVDLAPVGIIQTDTRGKRVFCNSRWCEMTGITLEQALGDTHYETIYPPDLDYASHVWANMMATHLPFENAVFRYQRPDKSTVWVSGNGRPLYDAHHEITGYIGSVTDITESRNTQEKLRQERDLMRTLIDHMPDYIFLKDAEGRFVLTNEAHAAAGGITPPSAMIGKTAFDVFSSDLARQFYADDQAIMHSGTALINAERTTVDAQGNRKTVLTTKIPWQDSSGKVLGLIGISRDITERKQLEEALLTSELRFRTLVDLAPVGIVETDPHGSIILANAQWYALSGLNLQDRLVDNGSTTIHPDDLPKTQAVNQKMVETTGLVDNLEYRFIHPDGQVVWVSDSSRPVFDPDGDLTGYIIAMTDITERKRLEAELRQNEERLRLITDNIQDLVIQSDTEGRIVYMSPSSRTMLGYEPQEMIGKLRQEFVHPDDRVNMTASRQVALKTGGTHVSGEGRLRHADGHYIDTGTEGTLLLDDQSKYIGTVLITRDITERKRLEEELRRNEERLRIITDNFPDLITQSDASGYYTFVSPSAQTLLGYSAESLVGTPALAWVHPEDIESMSESFLKAAALANHQITGEFRLRHADGHYIDFEVVGKLLFDDANNFVSGVFISRDVSERKRMQNLLLEKEKLQTALGKELELNDLKTRMMSRIAHEFRTPLTVIQASTETLTHYFDRLTTAQKDSKEVVIKGQIQRLTDMLDEISLVMNGSFTPLHVHPTTTDLGLLCQQMAGQLERQVNLPGKFALDIPESATASVDGQVLRNAILHIMRNAARFSKPSGIVKISLTSDENNIQLRITDTGIGILPEELPRIFDPFFRGSNISEISGLGIGLTIARAAVDAHDGTIRVESVVGEGTTVTINIPV